MSLWVFVHLHLFLVISSLSSVALDVFQQGTFTVSCKISLWYILRSRNSRYWGLGYIQLLNQRLPECICYFHQWDSLGFRFSIKWLAFYLLLFPGLLAEWVYKGNVSFFDYNVLGILHIWQPFESPPVYSIYQELSNIPFLFYLQEIYLWSRYAAPSGCRHILPNYH